MSEVEKVATSSDDGKPDEDLDDVLLDANQHSQNAFTNSQVKFYEEALNCDMAHKDQQDSEIVATVFAFIGCLATIGGGISKLNTGVVALLIGKLSFALSFLAGLVAIFLKNQSHKRWEQSIMASERNLEDVLKHHQTVVLLIVKKIFFDYKTMKTTLWAKLVCPVGSFLCGALNFIEIEIFLKFLKSTFQNFSASDVEDSTTFCTIKSFANSIFSSMLSIITSPSQEEKLETASKIAEAVVAKFSGLQRIAAFDAAEIAAAEALRLGDVDAQDMKYAERSAENAAQETVQAVSCIIGVAIIVLGSILFVFEAVSICKSLRKESLGKILKSMSKSLKAHFKNNLQPKLSSIP